MAPAFGTESILLLISLFLLVASALVFVIWKQRPVSGENHSTTGPQNLRESFTLVRQSAHLQAIACLICLSSVVTTIATWQLTTTAKTTLVETDVLTAYLGGFLQYAGILSLA